MIKIYGKNNIDKIKYIAPDIYLYFCNFIKKDKGMIEGNLVNTLIIQVNRRFIPVTVELESSNYCGGIYSSLYLGHKKNGFFKKLFNKFNKHKIVEVNNWYLNKNPLSYLTPYEIQKITHYLKVRFPNHVILIKNLNNIEHLETFRYLKDYGYNKFTLNNIYVNTIPEIAFPKIEYTGKKEFLLEYNNIFNANDYKQIYSLYLNSSEYNGFNLYSELFIRKLINSPITKTFVFRNFENVIVGFTILNQTTEHLNISLWGFSPTCENYLKKLSVFEASLNYSHGTFSIAFKSFKELCLNNGFKETSECALLYIDHLSFLNRKKIKFFRFLHEKLFSFRTFIDK